MRDDVRMRRLQTGLALGGLLALVLLVAFKWSSLPPTIPIHFGADGKANGYGSRIWLWFPVGMAILMYGALGAVKRAPQMYNLPALPGSAQRQDYEKLAAQMIGWLRVTLVWMFFGLAILEIRGCTKPGWTGRSLPAACRSSQRCGPLDVVCLADTLFASLGSCMPSGTLGGR